jgi:beta-glucosidase
MKQNPVLFQAIVLVISLITSSNAALDSATIEKKVDSLLGLMTLAEKAGQMTMVQINSSGTASQRVPDSKVASMGIGSVFNGGSDASVPANTPAAWAAVIDRVQNAVMNSSRLKIPIIYGQDCVHGVGAIQRLSQKPPG